MYADDVDLLDLCILAYQLHAQTLVMRTDPYGEYMRSKGRARHIPGAQRRRRFLEALSEEIDALPRPLQGPSYAGPGFMRSPVQNQRNNPPLSWPNNNLLDPVLSDYSRVCPHLPGLVQQYKHHEGWIIYRARTSITDRIGRVFVVEYDSNNGPSSANPTFHHPNPAPYPHPEVPCPLQAPAANPQPDLLYCFEGGTGGAASNDGKIWTLMGFVLAREDTASAQPQKPYDVFIVFRGSRSGRFSAARTLGSLSVSKGNSDWVTNTEFATTSGRTQVSSHPIHRGFVTAVETCLPAIKDALLNIPKNYAPRSIYVTGHSLGGALARCFANAVLLGQFGQQLMQAMPKWAPALRTLNLKTFAAPPVGEIDFMRDFNSVLPGAQNWRLPEDSVPTLLLKNPTYSYQQIGTDMPLPSLGLNGEQSHSPDNLRRAMQTFLNLAPHNRPQDPEKPWRVEPIFNVPTDANY